MDNFEEINLFLNEIDRLDSGAKDLQERKDEAVKSLNRKIGRKNEAIEIYVANIAQIIKRLSKQDRKLLPKEIEIKTNRWALRLKNEKETLKALIEFSKSFFIRRKIERV